MSEEALPYGNPPAPKRPGVIRVEMGIGTPPAPWLSKPTGDGWWIVNRLSGQFSDLALVRFERGQCFTEIGAPCGTPMTVEFEGARWCGPVERP